jgi:hypothetical protein
MNKWHKTMLLCDEFYDDLLARTLLVWTPRPVRGSLFKSGCHGLESLTGRHGLACVRASDAPDSPAPQ